MKAMPERPKIWIPSLSANRPAGGQAQHAWQTLVSTVVTHDARQLTQHVSMLPITSTLEDAAKSDVYVLLNAIGRDGFEISEVSDHGSVNHLLVKNFLGKAVFVLAGEAVVGAKQNRTFNVSMLLPPGQETVVTVTCIESGRWSAHANDVRAAKGMMPSSTRRTMMDDVGRRMEEPGQELAADQMSVWSQISNRLVRMRMRTRTQDMNELLEHKDLTESTREIPAPLQDQIGAVFLVDDAVVGLELFRTSDLFAASMRRLTMGYGLDAMTGNSSARTSWNDETIESVLLLINRCKFLTKDSPGLGSEVHVTAESFVGHGLAVGDSIVHFAAMPRV